MRQPTEKEAKILSMIIDDLQNDAAKLDGTPLTGANVARIFGEFMATTRALALLVKGLTLSEEEAITLWQKGG